MGIVERIAEARRIPQMSWPVGADVSMESGYGHDSEFPREEYADYIATSNEVFSAVTLRARAMSRLTLNLYHGRGSDKVAVKEDHPAARLLDHVNPFWTPRRLARMDEMSMGLWGESYWALHYGKGRAAGPTEIWWLKASRVKPLPDKDDYLKGFLYESTTGEALTFEPHEIVWFRYPNPRDEFSAMAPLAAARLAADTASAMMKSNRNLHAHGLQLGGVIVPGTDKVTFGEGQAEELEKLLENRWSKAKNARRWAVLRYEAQFKPMDISPKDAEFVAGLNLTLRQVANVYGVPVPMLNASEQTNYANIRELHHWLWEGALVPDAELKADEVREQLLPKFGHGAPDHAEFDFTTIEALQESQEASWGRERQAIEVGRVTINEVRKRHGEPPLPWGDVWWAPLNKAAVGDSTPEGDVASTGEDDHGATVDAETARALAEVIQKIYLGVGTVVTQDEARAIINQAGANLPIGDTEDEAAADDADDQDNEAPDGDEAELPAALSGPLGRAFLAELEEWRLADAAAANGNGRH